MRTANDTAPQALGRGQDTALVHLTDDLVLMRDPKVGQYILARNIPKARGPELKKFAFWRGGIGKLGREINRRSLEVPAVTLRTVPLEIFFASKGEPFAGETVYG